MPRRPSYFAIFLLIGLLLFQGFVPDLSAQAAPPPTPRQLDQLLAPIALYPDSLLAQITTASTNPQEILDVNNWLAQNPNLTGPALTDAAQQQGFDPAFIALVNFPGVLQMMANNIDDYAAIGDAALAEQTEVSASIQRLRAQAYASGALRSNPQQQVVVEQIAGQPTYIIQPVNPQVVYIPQYDPTVVYLRPGGALVGASLITFGLGIGIGALLVSQQPWGWHGWGWNWGGHRVYYNNAPWGGWHGGYRPPRPSYRPRPVMYNNLPGYRGNWGYRPPNYRPQSPVNRPTYNRPGNRPAARPIARPGNRPRVQPARPGTPKPRPVPVRPNATPPRQSRPAVNRPAHTPRPAPTNRTAPNNRPAPQKRAAPQNRPAPHKPSESKPAKPAKKAPAKQPQQDGRNRQASH